MSNELTERIRGATTFTTDVIDMGLETRFESGRRVRGELVLSASTDITDNQFNERTAIAAKKIIMLRIKLALYSEVVDALVSIRYALRDNSVYAADTMVQELIRYIDDIKYTGD